MTFRFDERQRQQLEKREVEVDGEDLDSTWIQSPFEERQDVPRLERTQRTKIKNDIYPRKSDKLNVITSPVQGWEDPFSRDEQWDSILINTPSSDDEIEPGYNHFDEAGPYDITPMDSGRMEWEDKFEGPELLDGVEEHGNSYRPRSPSSWWKVAGTVTGAVVTGALFGFVILSFFKTGADTQIPVHTNQQTVSINKEGNEPSNPDASGLAAPVSVSIQPQSYYMLQYGVFSSADRAEQAVKELQQYGIAAGRDNDQENRVYAGVSPDREQAKLLSGQLKTQGMELYVREVTTPAPTALRFNGTSDDLNQYFAVSDELIASLTQTSASLLGQDNPGALSNKETTALINLHQKWTESVKLLQTGLGSQEANRVETLEKSMNSALSALTEYNKNSSKGHLWEVQSSMMKYIMEQKQLMNSLEK
ncbi:SPOR domain-containing protein [Paenibacillus pini]